MSWATWSGPRGGWGMARESTCTTTDIVEKQYKAYSSVIWEHGPLLWGQWSSGLMHDRQNTILACQICSCALKSTVVVKCRYQKWKVRLICETLSPRLEKMRESIPRIARLFAQQNSVSCQGNLMLCKNFKPGCPLQYTVIWGTVYKHSTLARQLILMNNPNDGISGNEQITWSPWASARWRPWKYCWDSRQTAM